VETIEALGETIVPGARAAGIAQFIDQLLSVPLEEALLEARILGNHQQRQGDDARDRRASAGARPPPAAALF
jgi:hypothetical protein